MQSEQQPASTKLLEVGTIGAALIAILLAYLTSTSNSMTGNAQQNDIGTSHCNIYVERGGNDQTKYFVNRVRDTLANNKCRTEVFSVENSWRDDQTNANELLKNSSARSQIKKILWIYVSHAANTLWLLRCSSSRCTVKELLVEYNPGTPSTGNKNDDEETSAPDLNNQMLDLIFNYFRLLDTSGTNSICTSVRNLQSSPRPDRIDSSTRRRPDCSKQYQNADEAIFCAYEKLIADDCRPPAPVR